MPDALGDLPADAEERPHAPADCAGRVARDVCMMADWSAVPRPRYHFTPSRGWLNDPNGLVFHDGNYHLFYQHHPDSTSWGPMHWGHAVSADLQRWRHRPIALVPDTLGMIFSGSAVVDRHDTAGFGRDSLIAVFTNFVPGREVQSLAYSRDSGRTWTKYLGNPVLEGPPDVDNFRDPKVSWYPTGERTGYWIMALAVGNEIWFYQSPDLRTWRWTGRFTSAHVPGRYETPDLVKLPVQGTSESRWVLSFGSGIEELAGTATSYVVGHFDGQTFVPDMPEAPPRLADHGPDFYAAQSWNDDRHGEHVWIGWMNNWAYAEEVPASTWRGMLSTPRRLTLQHDNETVLLGQHPVLGPGWRQHPAMSGARRESRTRAHHLLDLAELPAAFDLSLTVDRARSDGEQFMVELLKGGDVSARLTYNLHDQHIQLDRSMSECAPGAETNREGSRVSVAGHDAVDLRVLADTASVEVFALRGTIAISAQCLPVNADITLRLRPVGGHIETHSLQLNLLDG